MTKQTKIVLVIFMIIMVLGMLWLFGGSKTNEKTLKRPYVSSEWTTKYQPNEKNPYDLFLWNSLLKAHLDSTVKYKDIQFANQLDSIDKSNSTMVFVGDRFGLKNDEIDTILAKVESGSDLFLSYNELTENINQKLFDTSIVSYDFTEKIAVYIGKFKFTELFLFQNDTIAHQWKAFTKIVPKDSVYRSLSSFMEMPNFVRIKHGKGTVYIHTNPDFFCNFQIKRQDGYFYASYVINQFAKDKDIYFLELGRLLDEKDEIQEAFSDEEGNGDKVDDSYLQFILKSPAFIAAMALTFIGLLLFLLFRAKRTQPIVPYIPGKKDMSLAFAETITSIYLAKQNPFGLLQVQRKNFYDAVYKHFFVDLNRKTDDRERDIEILSQKSNVGIDEINYLIQGLEVKTDRGIDDNYIVEISKRQRKFYEQTGMIHSKVLQKISEVNGTINREMVLSVILILLGIVVVLIGFNFLVKAIGIGILLWPLGTIILAYGVIRLSKPLLILTGATITYIPLFGKRKVYDLNDLMQFTMLKEGVVMNFTKDRKVLINYREMSRFDKERFKLFIDKHQQFEGL